MSQSRRSVPNTVLSVSEACGPEETATGPRAQGMLGIVALALSRREGSRYLTVFRENLKVSSEPQEFWHKADSRWEGGCGGRVVKVGDLSKLILSRKILKLNLLLAQEITNEEKCRKEGDFSIL